MHTCMQVRDIENEAKIEASFRLPFDIVAITTQYTWNITGIHITQWTREKNFTSTNSNNNIYRLLSRRGIIFAAYWVGEE